ncbi:MAG TPA: VPA1267 family protein [Spirochaetia bacterium]|nr:VPA1267 family protein [Spirochaetia bacterium]
MNATHNLSGKQKADHNLATFLSWIAGKTDSDFREMVVRGQLSRQEIARECCFARSVLLQNPRVRDELRSLETQLRERGVLPSQTSDDIPSVPVAQANPHAAEDKARMKRLESENAALKAELTELRGELDRYRVMDNILCSTGRLPR